VLTTGARVPFYFISEGRQVARLRKGRKEPLAELHPRTAAKYGIEDGDWMWIENERGRIRQKAKLVDGMQKDTVAIEFGWWFPEQKQTPDMGIYKSGANMLTSNAPPFDPQMGTYQLRGLLCRIEKADSSPLEDEPLQAAE
jgi:anaerobic selenocysteine-containing dehydrogenase